MSWHLGRLCGFDLETTGVNVERDRIVTACVVQCGGDQPTVSATWLADPGIDIPEQAEKVHGVSTERARAEGQPAAEVVAEVLAALGQVIASGIPVVAMNARFDLTVLDREARRYGLDPLPDGFPVLDPLVLDKHIDKFRRGRRTLTALCEQYEVPLDHAHSADADAVAACHVVQQMAQAYPDLPRVPLPELHALQVQWAREQAAGLERFLRQTNPAAHCPTEWPLIPHQRGEQ